MLALITVAYNQAGATRKLVESFGPGHVYLFLHSRRPEVVQVCEEISKRGDVVYYPYGNNPGLASSWNTGIHQARRDGAEVIIVANNDIEFVPGAVDEMARIAHMHPEKYIVTCGHGYSCFIIQPVALDTIGYFDEAIKPAYYEDCDYARRAHLAGLQSIDLPDLGVKHAGNGTIKNERGSYQRKYRHDMARLRTYYRRKWGGGPLMEPEVELYDKPFGTGELYYSYRDSRKA